MTEAEYKDQHPEYDENESEEEQPSEMTLADALKICDCVNFSYTGMSEKEREELDTAFDLVWRAADKHLKSLQNATAGDCISRSYLKQMIPAPIEDEYKRVHQIIDNAPPVDIKTEVSKELAKEAREIADENYKYGYEKGKTERPQGEWIKEPNGRTTDIYRCSKCKRSIMLLKGADLANYPFCHCGADMRGDKE